MIDKILVRNRVYSFWVIKKYQFFIFFFLWIFCLILYSTTQTTMYYTPNLDGNTCRNNYSREHVCTSPTNMFFFIFLFFYSVFCSPERFRHYLVGSSRFKIYCIHTYCHDSSPFSFIPPLPYFSCPVDIKNKV